MIPFGNDVDDVFKDFGWKHRYRVSIQGLSHFQGWSDTAGV